MGKLIQLAPGTRFGRLIVLRRFIGSAWNVGAKWVCRCDCGRVMAFPSYDLRAGRTTSCGCRRAENMHAGKPYWMQLAPPPAPEERT